MSVFQQKVHSMIESGRESTTWKDKTNIKIQLRYGTDAGMMRKGSLMTVRYILRILLEKLDNPQEQMGNVRKKVKILKNRKEMLKIKIIVIAVEEDLW